MSHAGAGRRRAGGTGGAATERDGRAGRRRADRAGGVGQRPAVERLQRGDRRAASARFSFMRGARPDGGGHRRGVGGAASRRCRPAGLSSRDRRGDDGVRRPPRAGLAAGIPAGGGGHLRLRRRRAHDGPDAGARSSCDADRNQRRAAGFGLRGRRRSGSDGRGDAAAPGRAVRVRARRPRRRRALRGGGIGAGTETIRGPTLPPDFGIAPTNRPSSRPMLELHLFHARGPNPCDRPLAWRLPSPGS